MIAPFSIRKFNDNDDNNNIIIIVIIASRYVTDPPELVPDKGPPSPMSLTLIE